MVEKEKGRKYFTDKYFDIIRGKEEPYDEQTLEKIKEVHIELQEYEEEEARKSLEEYDKRMKKMVEHKIMEPRRGDYRFTKEFDDHTSKFLDKIIADLWNEKNIPMSRWTVYEPNYYYIWDTFIGELFKRIVDHQEKVEWWRILKDIIMVDYQRRNTYILEYFEEFNLKP